MTDDEFDNEVVKARKEIQERKRLARLEAELESYQAENRPASKSAIGREFQMRQPFKWMLAIIIAILIFNIPVYYSPVDGHIVSILVPPSSIPILKSQSQSSSAISLECIVGTGKDMTDRVYTIDFTKKEIRFNGNFGPMVWPIVNATDESVIARAEDGATTTFDRRTLAVTITGKMFNLPLRYDGQCTLIDANADKPKF